MSGYVDPFEEFKKKAETKKAAKKAVANAATAADVSDQAPAEMERGHAEKKAVEEIQADLVRPQMESSLERGQGGKEVATLAADAIGESSLSIDRIAKVPGDASDSNIEVNEVKPTGFETHIAEDVDVSPDELQKPDGFSTTLLTSEKSNEEQAQPAEKPAGFTKF